MTTGQPADIKSKLSEYPSWLPESKVRSYFTITDPELVESFIDPIKRTILVTLRKGIDSLQKEEKREVIEKDDGTKVTTTVVEERVVKRFWMTVPEIVQMNLGEMDLSTYNCYYHLPKLIEQGLVEEFVPEGKESSTKRGIYYRRTAKVFLVSSAKMRGNLVQQFLTLFEKGFDLSMDDRTHQRLEDLLVRQVEMVDEAMEYLAVHLKEVDMDSTVLNDILTEMSFVFLSDSQEFIDIQRELKRMALTPCCGPATDMMRVCSYCGETLDANNVVTRTIAGKIQTFCSEKCADAYESSYVPKL